MWGKNLQPCAREMRIHEIKDPLFFVMYFVKKKNLALTNAAEIAKLMRMSFTLDLANLKTRNIKM